MVASTVVALCAMCRSGENMAWRGNGGNELKQHTALEINHIQYPSLLHNQRSSTWNLLTQLHSVNRGTISTHNLVSLKERTSRWSRFLSSIGWASGSTTRTGVRAPFRLSATSTSMTFPTSSWWRDLYEARCGVSSSELLSSFSDSESLKQSRQEMLWDGTSID